MNTSMHPSEAAAPAASMSGTTYRTIDEFHRARGDDWIELAAILAKVGPRGIARLGPEATARFATLYRAVSADLAISRLRFGRSPVTTELNRLIAHAHAVMYAEPVGVAERFVRFLVVGFPRAVRRHAGIVGLAIALMVASVFAGWLWYRLAPDTARGAFGLGTTFNRAEIPLAASPVTNFAEFLMIAVNNIVVTLMAFVSGVTIVGAGIAIIYNGMLLGVLAGLSIAQGRIGDLLALILPHGIVELSIICIAIAGGLHIGFTMLDPGRRRWSLAVKDASLVGLRLYVGTVPLFVVAALVEGFITPAGMPIPVNIAIGIVFGAVLWTYLAVLGRDVRRPAASLSAAASGPSPSGGAPTA